jgi:ribonuclease P protein component
MVAARAVRRSRSSALRRRSEFEAVLAHDCGQAGRLFVVRAMPNRAGQARLGLIFGKKASPRAVDRNRGRRLAREAFRAAAPALGALDVVVQLRGNLRMHDNAAVRRELARLLAGLERCRDAGGAGEQRRG